MGLREDFFRRAETFELTEIAIGFLRPLSKGVKSLIESIASNDRQSPKDCTDMRFHALKWSLVDAECNPLLTAEDRKIFDGWDDSLIEPIFEKIMEITKVTEKDREAFEKK